MCLCAYARSLARAELSYGMTSSQIPLALRILLLTAWFGSMGAGAAPNSSPSFSVPKPAGAHRVDLPEPLRKTVPTSIDDLRSIEQYVKALIPKISPAVVAVQIGDFSGSGVVISSDGLVLTAGHVAGSPNRSVRVTFPDGKTVRGRTVGSDEYSDTGLMRITEAGPWPHVPVGDLKETHLGDWVLALGNPGGFDPKRSPVVRLGRIITMVPGVLQSDCTISPGDSGGPLIDMHGRVVGIHSAISTSLAENYHVPITEVYDTWGGLVASQRHSTLGATLKSDDRGCRVTAVESSGPASRAGLKAGDHIVRIEGRHIFGPSSVERWLAETKPGEILKIEVQRGDKTLPFSVTLGQPSTK
jgi:serine protease Do